MIAFPHPQESLAILFVGAPAHRDGMEKLRQQFPRAHINPLTIEEIPTTASQPSAHTYHYIYIEPTVGKKMGSQFWGNYPFGYPG